MFSKKNIFTLIALLLGLYTSIAPLHAQRYQRSNERVPAFPREFRAAWIACVYNIDWPSRQGLSAAQSKAELRRIVNRASQLKLNALIFQVRPNADAVYRSSIEPYSHWLSGTMGRSPGYDPLAYLIQHAHAVGIEVHAWFNPFRALPNASIPVARNHISRTHKSIIKRYKNYKWINPASGYGRERALNVMHEVASRYDVDGIHIDDYFYPYPTLKNNRPVERFPDGKSTTQRRAYVDAFVRQMYFSLKQHKPHLRIGISPFGIWRPGVPRGTSANIDSYEHLACDSRKWLAKGWCDYLSPQLYWRIDSEQSYSKLLSWWRAQGQRPVWPGIATERINSSDDPGRPASEIINQVKLSRSIGRNWVGHAHWSMKSLLTNRGGVTTKLLRETYQYPALVPPMPWMQTPAPPAPVVRIRTGSDTSLGWQPVPHSQKYAIQARYGARWYPVGVTAGHSYTLRGAPDAIAVYAIDRFGTNSAPSVFTKY